ncbi:SPP1 family phage portal protein [Heliophilum fasciatum]|uniref:SPP1 family phage portal protein n=2 Tax=Heliophilum fasciatum TaxID=35700 RepID=A0A4R2RLF2_9FIRM|nr:SPP1 family phage portal protein [Heliophilum fasciatum]
MEQIIKLEIDEWKVSPELRLMVTGQRYYTGDHDILQRRRLVIGENGALVEDTNLANRKLVHTLYRKLVDQKVGYLLSKPLTVQTENQAYADQWRVVMDKGFHRLLKNLGKEAINKGRAWIQVFYDESGKLSFKRIPAEEVIPLWRDAERTQLDGVIRMYDVETYEGTVKKIVTKVEYWDTSGVKRYVMPNNATALVPDDEGDGSHFTVTDSTGKETPYNWERVPFICFRYNDEELPLIKFVQSLVDDYDLQTSDHSNNLADLPNGIYIIKNYDGTDLGEFRRNLSVYRAVKVTEDGGLDTLSLDINTDALKAHLEALRKDLYECGRGVDTQSDKFGNSPSGIALRFLYSDLDMDANILETEFQASLEQLRWFVDNHLANTGAGDFATESIDFLFNRDILINETEAITNAKNSTGVISDETIISNHPWVTDPEEEQKRLEKQRTADLEEMQAYSGMGDVNGNGNTAGGVDA